MCGVSCLLSLHNAPRYAFFHCSSYALTVQCHLGNRNPVKAPAASAALLPDTTTETPSVRRSERTKTPITQKPKNAVNANSKNAKDVLARKATTVPSQRQHGKTDKTAGVVNGADMPALDIESPQSSPLKPLRRGGRKQVVQSDDDSGASLLPLWLIMY